MTQDPALCGVLRQASRGDSKETHGLAGFGGAVASVRWISGGELGRERLLLDCFGCDSRTRQCWRKSSFGFTAICPVNGGQACDERQSDQCLAPINGFLGDPKVRRLIRDEMDKLRKLEIQPIAA